MSKYKTLILDVSKWNAKTKLSDFKKCGFSGVIIRAGYGLGNIDRLAEKWYKEAYNLGMDIGAYWFSYAKTVNEALMEAEHLIAWATQRKITLPLCFDFENASKGLRKISKEAINAFGKAFCRKIEEANYYAMFYSNKDYYQNVWDSEMKEKYDCWYARYQPIDVIKSDIPGLHLCQYDTKYNINGYNISQDVNYDFIGLSDIITRRGLVGK